MDVKSVFLFGDLLKEIHMQQLESFCGQKVMKTWYASL
jgi:hypothetical protein